MARPTRGLDINATRESGLGNCPTTLFSGGYLESATQGSRVDCRRCFTISVSTGESEVSEAAEAPEMGRKELIEHLGAFSKDRLVDEVISVWQELGEVERELAMARQRARALDSELGQTRSRVGGRGDLAEVEERFRVAEARRAQLETMLQNERARRRDLEEVVGEGRVDDLRRENAALIRREEEHLLLILDMESKIDELMELVSKLEQND